jgi:transcriptional regulator with XRE-family HTH domain
MSLRDSSVVSPNWNMNVTDSVFRFALQPYAGAVLPRQLLMGDSSSMVRTNSRQVRTATHIQLVSKRQSPASDSVQLPSAEVGNDGPPLGDSSRADVQRPRDIRGSLKVINNVLLEHTESFTTVKSAMQPGYQSKALTLVDMDKQLTTIADRLKAAMKDAGDISMSQLGRACGVSPAAVSKWLNGGKLTADNQAAAARALGVREEWLRTGKLPREREQRDVEQNLDEVVDLLEDLKGPLAALAAAIEKIGKARPPSVKKRDTA